eukprot:scaffold55360_cov114-Phaeocystis_antarctica.AAC.2
MMSGASRWQRRDGLVVLLWCFASERMSEEAGERENERGGWRGAAELELSCGPSTTQLEAAEDQARWAPAMQRGRRCRRRGRSRRPHHRPRCVAYHWSRCSRRGGSARAACTARRMLTRAAILPIFNCTTPKSNYPQSY